MVVLPALLLAVQAAAGQPAPITLSSGARYELVRVTRRADLTVARFERMPQAAAPPQRMTFSFHCDRNQYRLDELAVTKGDGVTYQFTKAADDQAFRPLDSEAEFWPLLVAACGER